VQMLPKVNHVRICRTNVCVRRRRATAARQRAFCRRRCKLGARRLNRHYRCLAPSDLATEDPWRAASRFAQFTLRRGSSLPAARQSGNTEYPNDRRSARDRKRFRAVCPGGPRLGAGRTTSKLQILNPIFTRCCDAIVGASCDQIAAKWVLFSGRALSSDEQS
jgi:hypothetical protein